MKINVRDLCFGYSAEPLFDHFSADFDGGDTGLPLVILGPSGSGKTTLLKLLGGLLKPQAGDIQFSDECLNGDAETGAPKTAFMFQEPRLLPWLTVLENVSLPLEKIFGKEEARHRAKHFLSLVFLEEKEEAYPKELSGGQAQRVSMARAFAWPAPVLFMDEPFQSLDIPLRINLMDMTLSLLAKENISEEKHLLIAAIHEPREALYMGGRIIILGGAGQGIVFDRIVDPGSGKRIYGSGAMAELEREMIQVLQPL